MQNKMFWLWQWKQIREQARLVIKRGTTEDINILIVLLECENGKFPKTQLEDKIMQVIMENTTPIDSPKNLYSQEEMF